MARLYQSGFELQSNVAEIEWDSNVGTTPDISTSIKRSGLASMRVHPTGATSFFRHQVIASSNTGILYARCYVYIVTNPTAGGMTLMSLGNSGAGTIGDIVLNDNNSFFLNGNAGKIGSDSSTVNLNTWNLLELSADDASGSNTVTAKLNGVQFATGTGRSIATGTAFLWLGFIDSGTGDAYFDDWGVNDASGSSQTSWLGAGSIVHLYPSAAGDNAAWTRSGTDSGANWSQVNEVIPDTVSAVISNTLNQTDDHNINDTPSAIGATDTINVVAVGVYWGGTSNSLTGASMKVRIKKAAAGTVLSSSEFSPGASTTQVINASSAPKTPPLITYLDPDGATWTKATLDSAQIGYIVSTTHATNGKVSDIWLSVDYTPSVNPPGSIAIKNLTGLRPKIFTPGVAR